MIYGDWLEEHGHLRHAKLVRLLPEFNWFCVQSDARKVPQMEWRLVAGPDKDGLVGRSLADVRRYRASKWEWRYKTLAGDMMDWVDSRAEAVASAEKGILTHYDDWHCSCRHLEWVIEHLALVRQGVIIRSTHE